ncbi:hypothetical protein QJQ45_006616 [Haematococcus lacustris]|nr:hypothetical protein QJQ45_006616 [Haematococcus lacustris]
MAIVRAGAGVLPPVDASPVDSRNGAQKRIDRDGVPLASMSSQSSIDEQEQELVALSTLPAKEAGYEGIVGWVGAAMAFGAGVWYVQGPQKAQEFFAGYLLEQSLSVDNLFVFILVFNYFKTPLPAQSKVLAWGIASAAVLRGVFIIAGVELIEVFRPLLLLFAGILVFSAAKLLTAGDDEDDDEDLSNNAVVRLCRSFIKSTDHYDGDRFWSVMADGSRSATPLLLTLAVIELSDVVFAVDSIPAVFGVTLDPFIIYTSNIFAVLSLRALYRFVSTVMTELRFLDKAVAIVLGFIGVKMTLGFADVDIPTDVSLLIVGLVLGGGWKPPAGQVEARLVRPAWSQQRDQPVRGLMWCPVVAPRKPPQPPRCSQEATQPAASEPGPSTPPPAKRSKRTKAEQPAQPTQPTKGKGKGKAAKAKPAPQPGRWLDRDCNAALNMQRSGESRWRPLELCYWPDQGALPAKGKEYPGLGYKRLRDKLPKAQERQPPAVAQPVNAMVTKKRGVMARCAGAQKAREVMAQRRAAEAEAKAQAGAAEAETQAQADAGAYEADEAGADEAGAYEADAGAYEAEAQAQADARAYEAQLHQLQPELQQREQQATDTQRLQHLEQQLQDLQQDELQRKEQQVAEQQQQLQQQQADMHLREQQLAEQQHQLQQQQADMQQREQQVAQQQHHLQQQQADLQQREQHVAEQQHHLQQQQADLQQREQHMAEQQHHLQLQQQINRLQLQLEAQSAGELQRQVQQQLAVQQHLLQQQHADLLLKQQHVEKQLQEAADHT